MFLPWRTEYNSDDDRKKCARCGAEIEQDASYCPLCLKKRRANSIAQAGCLAAVLAGVLISFLVYIIARQDGAGSKDIDNKYSMADIAGRYVSDFDYRYILRVEETESGKDEANNWDGLITFSGPNMELNGRSLRCGVSKDILLVELVAGAETTAVEMFFIEPGIALKSRIDMHWPGIFKRIK